MRYLILLLCAILLAVASFFSVQLFNNYKEINTLQYDAAEIKKVNYGLFNLQLWKEKALDIFSKRISEFKISPKAYDGLEKQVDVFIKQMFDDYIVSGKLIDEIAVNLENNSKIPKLFISTVKKNVKDQMKNIDIDSQIPGITKQISSEIRKSEPQLRKIMQDELMSMVMDTEETKYVERRTKIYNKYEFDEPNGTLAHIDSAIAGLWDISRDLTKYIIASLAAILLLLIITIKIPNIKDLILGFTLASIILLCLGVTLPTIDLDARLNSFSIDLVGEKIEFEEQVLYFESKSILGVTKTLWDGAGIDLKIVAILIFLFSILFPFIKLLLSTLFLYFEKIRTNKLSRTILFHLGKWSMADVFVIALFMAYIGFYGLVTSQLGSIARNETGYAVETLNYTSLGPGALFFTSYVVLSIITSVIIQKNEL